MDDPTSLNPERIGLVAVLVTLIGIGIRAVAARSWLPRIYFDEVKAERDRAREVSDKATDLAADLAKQLERMTTTCADVSKTLERITSGWKP